ncbi:MAG: DNA repair protein RecO [Sphingobacteriia bacterium]|nr:MAG: DNA repair protein RecO [Sphingobacteriia bacterium]
MTVHATRGIVLRSLPYGDTSLVCSIYTELFGKQSYLVKGVRAATKKSVGKAGYFQPGAILDLEVYHNSFKDLQFLKSFYWGHVYQSVFFDVVKNAVATYVVEVMQLVLKEPEANPELFYLIEDSLKQLDKGSPGFTANLPLYFTLHLAAELGFMVQGEFSAQTPILDLQEGQFVAQYPSHPHHLDGDRARISSELGQLPYYEALEGFSLNQQIRRQLLDAYLLFLQLHIPGFGTLKSYGVLKEVLG